MSPATRWREPGVVTIYRGAQRGNPIVGKIPTMLWDYEKITTVCVDSPSIGHGAGSFGLPECARGTKVIEHAVLATGPTGRAHGTAVQDQPQAEGTPFIGGDHR